MPISTKRKKTSTKSSSRKTSSKSTGRKTSRKSSSSGGGGGGGGGGVRKTNDKAQVSALKKMLSSGLGKARDIQWDYQHLVKRKGRLERLK